MAIDLPSLSGAPSDSGCSGCAVSTGGEALLAESRLQRVALVGGEPLSLAMMPPRDFHREVLSSTMRLGRLAESHAADASFEVPPHPRMAT